MTEEIIINESDLEDEKYNEIRIKLIKEKDVSEQYVILAEYFLTKYNIKTNWFTKEIYIYNYPEKGIFNSNGEILLLQEIQSIIPTWKRAAKREIIDKVMINTYFVDNIFNKQNIVVVENGVIRLDFLALNNDDQKFFSDFSSDFLATKKLPIKFDPKALCPKIDTFFTDISNGDKDMPIYLLEILADILNNHYKSQKGHIFMGDGENGKGTFMRLLIAFVGIENKTALGLEFIQEGSFQVYTLQNSMVNIIGDLNDKYVKDTGLVKKLLGEDFVSANIKNVKQPIEFINTAKMILAGQHIMKTNEDSWAWYRRFIITTWSFRVCEEKKYDGFENELQDPNELSGLLNKVLNQYKMFANNKFKFQMQHKLSEEEIRQNHLLKANPVKLFIEKEIVVTSDDETIPKRDIYKAYCEWQQKHNAKKKFENHFHREFKKEFGDIPIKQVKRVRHYIGIDLKLDNKDNNIESDGNVIKRLSYKRKILFLIKQNSLDGLLNEDLFEMLKLEGYNDAEKIRNALDILLHSGKVYQPKPDKFKPF